MNIRKILKKQRYFKQARREAKKSEQRVNQKNPYNNSARSSAERNVK